MLRSLARLGTRRPRIVLLGALVALVVAGVLGGPVAGLLGSGGDFDTPGSGSVRATERLEAATGREAGTGVVALVDTPRGADGAAGRAAAARAAATLRADPAVAEVTPPLAADDDRSAAVTGTLRAGADEDVVAERLDDAFAGRPDVTLGGPAIAGAQVGEQASEDLGRSELLAFPLLALLSLVLFRGGRAALLPLAVGLLTVLGTFLALRAVNEAYGLSVFALNLVIGLGLGLAIDYALFVLARFREELAAGQEVASAVRTTMVTAGRTVLFSALTVAAAMLALTVFAQRFLVSMGIGGALVALVAAAVALTVLPALLMLFGTRLQTRRPRRAPEASRWAAIARTAMRRPGLVTTVTVVGMLLVAVPALRVQWVGVDASVLPSSQSARVVADRMAADFRGLDDETVVLVASAPAGDGDAVAAYAQRVARATGVVGVDRPQRLTDGAWRIDATVPGPPSGERAQAALDAIRAVRAPFPVAAGGSVAETDDLQRSIASRAPLAIAVLAVGTLLLLWLLTGSVVLGLQALVINLLTLGVATGVVVLVFQDGRFEALLGYTSQGGLELSNFLVFAAIAFALSTDYGVMLLGRIKEARDAGLDDRTAVARGLGATGGLISAAAVLLAVALGAFVLAKVVFLKEIGVAAVVAVLVDAFVVRALLVPSLMALLRGWNWWSPAFLRRLHARIGLAHG